MVIPTEEFDFEQSNAKFDRTEEGGNDDDDDDDDDSHSDDEASRKPTSAFYQKSSFFDDISSESKERNAAREQPYDFIFPSVDIDSFIDLIVEPKWHRKDKPTWKRLDNLVFDEVVVVEDEVEEEEEVIMVIARRPWKMHLDRP